jgi:hypothetical protein
MPIVCSSSTHPRRRAVLGAAVATSLPLPVRATARTRLSIAAYPLIDEIVGRAARGNDGIREYILALVASEQFRTK